jgi:hypothetical protein
LDPYGTGRSDRDRAAQGAIGTLPDSIKSFEFVTARGGTEVFVMSLSPRFGVDVLGILAGAFLVVSAVAFSAPALGWIAFGVFTGLTVLGAAGAALSKRTSARIGHAVLGLVGLWSLIAALVFAGPVLSALVFADALAIVLVGLADLAVHELSTERVVHELEVRRTPVVTTTV